MTRIEWAGSAVEQLGLIRSLALRQRVYRAVGGLAKFPRRGRLPPEVLRFPDLELPSDLREIVFPKVVRVFYRFDEMRDLVRVLGMTFRGKEVGADWLASVLESE